MTAFASAVTFTDEDGANDEPGQKDLTLLTVDNAGLPTSLAVTWNWDVTTISGSNTVDGCSLFDSDGDSLGQLLRVRSLGRRSCSTQRGRDRPLHVYRPESRSLHGSHRGHDHHVVMHRRNIGHDPFVSGDSYPNDVKATCTINLADVGPPTRASQRLLLSLAAAQFGSLGLCSRATRRLHRHCESGDPGRQHGISIYFGWRRHSRVHCHRQRDERTDRGAKRHQPLDCRGRPAGWDLDSASCTLQGGGSTGSLVGSTISDIDVVGEQTTTCTFNDTAQGGTLIVIKHVINDNGGTATGGSLHARFGWDQRHPRRFRRGRVTGDVGDVGRRFVQRDRDRAFGLRGESTRLTVPGTIANGQTKTCTVTNDDQAATLTVIKHVINDNGGTARAG